MKTIQLFRSSILAAVFAAVTSMANAGTTFQRFDPGVGDFSIAIPETLNAYLVKETTDNSVHYKFKKSDGTTQFLFAVNKVTEQQWLAIKDQLTNASVQAHKNGFIYYVERTDKTSMKGPDKDAYANVYRQLDTIIRSIDIRG